MKMKTPDNCEPSDIDDVLSSLIKLDRRSFDVGLYQTKWWDYRFMTPYQATMEFVDAFGVEARRVYARDVDSERAEHITVITARSLTEKLLACVPSAQRAFPSFWRARQVADALGIPYMEYNSEALRSRMSRWSSIAIQDKNGKWRTKLPTPNQLYDERDVDKVEARWADLQRSRFYFANHHAYMVENYIASPIQNDYYAYLVNRARHSSSYRLSIGDLVEFNRIPIEYLAQNIEPDVFEQAVKPLLHH
jgi:hypothetical protein